MTSSIRMKAHLTFYCPLHVINSEVGTKSILLPKCVPSKTAVQKIKNQSV